jgi:hypothetical protein
MAGNGEFTISKERWEDMTETERSWILYDTFIQHRESCNKRFCRLERRKWLDKAFALAGGAGAALATIFGLQK